MVRALAGIAVLAAVLVLVFSGSEEEAEAQPCFGIRPFEFDTHEVYDNAGLYLAAIELAAAGEAVTTSLTPSGEPHGLEYPGLLTGMQDDRVNQTPDTSLRIPPTLLKSIVWVESTFGHADNAIPWGGVGQIKRSGDCGYGLGQITSGMENYAGSPSARQALVGTHFLFNVAEAARMLAEKWNHPYLPIAGEGDPSVVEDWYYAVWAYNGFAFVNHPQNPYLDPFRGDVWHCNDTSAPSWISTDGINPLFGYMAYTYPERVYGCMRHPPAYPEHLVSDPAYAPTPRPEVTPEPEPTGTETPDQGESEGENTTGGEETPTPTREATAAPEPTPEGDPWPAPGPDGIVRLWPPAQVNMPDMTIPAVAVAFSPPIYMECASALASDGCRAMHFSTSFPDLGIEPHRDPTPAVDPALRALLIGEPNTLITGPSSISIALDGEGQPESVEVQIQNVGTWIAPFRIQTSAPWILARREGNGRLDGGVTIGAETTVVLCTVAACGELITKRGHDTALIITLDLDELPEDEDVQGTITIEPLWGEGAVKVIDVHAGPSVEATTELEAHEDEEQALKHRIVVPNVTKDD
ncbi:MAG: hypothetical protein F4Z77_03695 [Dehalococcoidia bacterium]|nr:hypothetical protein [Dehalococcoidia bacterium]MYA53098.1 hypothetical protein [Dehalococcoidia bacterium]